MIMALLTHLLLHPQERGKQLFCVICVINLAAKQEQELVLEGYILAKGFNDAVVSFTDNYVNVMVKSGELNEAQVAQIVEVVQEQTSKSIDNIKIIPVE